MEEKTYTLIYDDLICNEFKSAEFPSEEFLTEVQSAIYGRQLTASEYFWIENIEENGIVIYFQ